jgi:ribosomal protein S18 acetylase RimI-like enzyme
LIIRKAIPEDIDRLTELHCASFSGQDHVPIILGPHYVKATYRWLVSSKMTYVLVAEKEGIIRGLIAVSDGPFMKPMFKACLSAFVFSILTQPRLIFMRKLWNRLLRRPISLAEGRCLLNSPCIAQMTIGAVDVAFRGQGIFDELVKATCIYSRARGSRAIRAGVYKNNLGSRRVFDKCGWIETKVLETLETVEYLYYLDFSLKNELGSSEKI